MTWPPRGLDGDTQFLEGVVLRFWENTTLSLFWQGVGVVDGRPLVPVDGNSAKSSLWYHLSRWSLLLFWLTTPPPCRRSSVLIPPNFGPQSWGSLFASNPLPSPPPQRHQERGCPIVGLHHPPRTRCSGRSGQSCP